ncbi:MAG: nucleotidyltransferase domain-containing protein [Bacteroidota bacterium]|nr:nucleotidyltransferase domain-containing protein [Bacteroidota bacterium]
MEKQTENKMMNNLIVSNIDSLRQLFETHKIEKAYVFGSVLTNDFKESSDIDFLVKFEIGIDPLEKGKLWWNLHDKLRDVLNREIDIVTERSLKNPYFIKELNKTKKLIYG